MLLNDYYANYLDQKKPSLEGFLFGELLRFCFGSPIKLQVLIDEQSGPQSRQYFKT